MTIIAAEITGRCCHAVELLPQHVDVAVQRWQAFTGESAMPSSERRKLLAPVLEAIVNASSDKPDGTGAG